MMVLPVSRHRIAWAVLCLSLFFLPERCFGVLAGIHALRFVAHILAFGLLACWWGRGCSRREKGRLLLSIILLSGAIELLQPLLGRSKEWSDWLFGILGGVVGVWGLSWRLPVRIVAFMGITAGVFLGFMFLECMEISRFPVLIDFSELTSRYGWELNQVKLGRLDQGVARVMVLTEGPYPGLFRSPRQNNWQQMTTLHAEIFWPEPASRTLWIRLDDRPGNPEYAERIQEAFQLVQGWNTLTINADQLRQTPGGRPFELNHIIQFGLFLEEGRSGEYFGFKRLWLELSTQ